MFASSGPRSISHHRLVVIVIVGALFFVPSMLLEAWFRQRERRRSEQILP